jgi:hypothetical protein
LTVVQRPKPKYLKAFVGDDLGGNKDALTLVKTDEVLDKFVADIVKTDDANDVLYALDASRDTDFLPKKAVMCKMKC